jgi:hypothetical protein
MERDLLVQQAKQMADSEAGQGYQPEAAYEEQQFINRFNHLLRALEDFSKQ